MKMDTYPQPEDVQLEIIGNDYTRILKITPNHDCPKLSSWITANRELVHSLYERYGALLFKGFKGFSSKQEFSSIVNFLSAGSPLSYAEPSTPRTQLIEHVYTSTEYPKEQSIAQHNEHSYSTKWPKKIFFYCEKPAQIGGQTPVSSSRSVYNLIPFDIVSLFEKKGGVRYVRSFSEEMDIKWKDFFGTGNKKEVEEYCREKNMQFEWVGPTSLRISYTAQAVLEDGAPDNKLWFNQAHLFHYSNLNEDIYTYLIEVYGIPNLPRNTYFKDGSAIEVAHLAEVRKAYEKAMFKFDWEESDLLFMDNVRYTHGRTPYTGDRSIIVAMSEEDSIANYH